MAKYIVEVIMTACVAVEVEAQSKREAQELAYEKADPFDVDDWDYDINCIYRDDEEEGE